MSAKNPEKKIKKSDKTENFDLPEQTESWLSNGLHRFMIVFSVMWFGIVAIYITKFFGWDNVVILHKICYNIILRYKK